MSRTKLAASAAAVAAAGLVGAIAFSGPASAGTNGSATYTCSTNQVPPVSYPASVAVATPSGTPTAAKLTLSTGLAAPIDIAQDTLTTTVTTSAGTFTGTKNPEMYAGDPIILGALSFSGTSVSSATLSTGSAKLTIFIAGPNVTVTCAGSSPSGTITWP
ncbi:hypothetical protein [Streptomyces sp. SID3343]|uniref:hypothetical protein n=1 Tax=Streptomyces sp. SID3343 TaxID=2690260 RepID=UPI00136DC28F|nr:hypothetical protein [Streptomyces sp. SID3343]MYW02117.1 hypothetical protein [Streptomyces sp. SID3343]